MRIDITQVVVAAFALLSAVITYIVYPWIKSKVGSAQWANICQWAAAGVQAAEVLFKGTGLGEEKRQYVMDFICGKCKEFGITFDETEARIALENAWKQMTATDF